MLMYWNYVGGVVLVWLFGVLLLHLMEATAPRPEYPELDLDKKREEIASRDSVPTEPLPVYWHGSAIDFMESRDQQ